MSDKRLEESMRPPASIPTAGGMAQRRKVNIPAAISPEEHERLKMEFEALKQEFANRPANSIIPVNGVIQAGRFQMSMLALEYPEDVTAEELDLFGDFLRVVIKAQQLWAGDWGNAYVRLHNAFPNWLASSLSVDPDTLAQWMRVCEKIPPRTRVQDLDYSIYREVAIKADKLGDRVEAVLKHAEKYALSVIELKAYIRGLLSNGKRRRVSMDDLFSKDKTPGLVEMRKDYASARKGDTAAIARVKAHIEAYRAWIKEVEQSLNLR